MGRRLLYAIRLKAHENLGQRQSLRLLMTGTRKEQRMSDWNLPWEGGCHSYEKLPAMNEYEGLAKAYAEQANKPARRA